MSDVEIEEKKRRINEIDGETPLLLEAMAALHDQWLAATVPWMVEQFDNDVTEAVADHRDRVRELKDSGELTHLKARIEEAKGEVEQTVTDLYKDDAEHWTHVTGEVHEERWDSRAFGSNGRETFYDALRPLRSRVPVLLYEAGLDTENPIYSGGNYRYGMAASTAMAEALRQYESKYYSYTKLVGEKTRLLVEIDQAEVADIWNEA